MTQVTEDQRGFSLLQVQKHFFLVQDSVMDYFMALFLSNLVFDLTDLEGSAKNLIEGLILGRCCFA